MTEHLALKENKLFFSTSNYYDDPFDTYIRIDRKLVYENEAFLIRHIICRDQCKKWRPYCVILGLNIEKDAKDSVIYAAKAAGISAIFEVRISEDDELELAEVSDKL